MQISTAYIGGHGKGFTFAQNESKYKSIKHSVFHSTLQIRFKICASYLYCRTWDWK
jgi:hypothetical protein